MFYLISVILDHFLRHYLGQKRNVADLSETLISCLSFLSVCEQNLFAGLQVFVLFKRKLFFCGMRSFYDACFYCFLPDSKLQWLFLGLLGSFMNFLMQNVCLLLQSLSKPIKKMSKTGKKSKKYQQTQIFVQQIFSKSSKNAFSLLDSSQNSTRNK